MTETTHLALPLIDAAQAQKHVTHNEALQLVDALVHLSVSARNQSAPPASPTEGQRFLVGAGATGAFAGKDFQIASFIAGGWIFLVPRAGWRVYVESESLLFVYDGAVWNDAGLTLRALQNLDLLGLGAHASAANPLSAKLDAALFTAKSVAEGGSGDLRLTLNKSATANTVSQLYQDNYSSRAETGLTGDDRFHVKVSADGSTWNESIVIDPATGVASFPSGVDRASLPVASATTLGAIKVGTNLSVTADGTMSLSGAVQNVASLAIGTGTDANNPISAKLNSALFDGSAGTGNIRCTLNKAAAADTASFLFQDNWSGRAEFGLTGDDRFHVKVSADGATWKESINIDPATGVASFSFGASFGGFVVLPSATVAALVAPSASMKGARQFASDLSGASYVFGAVAAGGGTRLGPVFCDGTNWREG